jgi:hypothetical protein
MKDRKGAINTRWRPSRLHREQLSGLPLRGLSCCTRRYVVPNLVVLNLVGAAQGAPCPPRCAFFDLEYFHEDRGHMVGLSGDNEGYLDVF